MNEKVIVKGEFAKNKIATLLLVAAGITFIGSVLVGVMAYNEDTYSMYSNFRDTISMTEHLTSGSLNRGNWFGLGYIAAIVLVVAAAYYWRKLSLCEITVSDKRVWGKTDFGKRVDLPLNQISAVAYGRFGGITVATASGAIHFWYLKNRDELHAAISQLLVVQQDKSAAPTVVMEKESTPEELKKYKELLDSNIITQEEFDAKKKQLLGL